MSNCVFNFSFLSLVLYKILGWSQIYIRGRCAPRMPLAENFHTQNECFGISNCIFNFNFLAVAVSEILGGSKFTLGGLRTIDDPQKRNFCTLSEYFTISNCVFNFSFLSLVLYEILGWSQIYIRGRCASLDAPRGKIFIPKTSTLAYLIAFLISTF